MEERPTLWKGNDLCAPWKVLDGACQVTYFCLVSLVAHLRWGLLKKHGWWLLQRTGAVGKCSSYLMEATCTKVCTESSWGWVEVGVGEKVKSLSGPGCHPPLPQIHTHFQGTNTRSMPPQCPSQQPLPGSTVPSLLALPHQAHDPRVVPLGPPSLAERTRP